MILSSRIKKEYPHIQFILNGGIDSIEKALALSKIHDGSNDWSD